MRIDHSGKRTVAEFDIDKLCYNYGLYPYYFGRRAVPHSAPSKPAAMTADERNYLDELKSVAHFFGYSDADIDALVAEGFTIDDIEEVLYCA